MRAVLSAVVAGVLLLGGGVAMAQSKSGGARSTGLADPSGIGKQTGPVDGRIGDLTRGPGAGEIQPDRHLVPPVAGSDHGVADGTRGHVPTDQELARGVAPAIVELPPVARPLEFADEGVHNAHRGAGHE